MIVTIIIIIIFIAINIVIVIIIMTMTRNKEMPCLNCRLIEMGEMACYQVSTISISISIVITIIIISIVNTIIVISIVNTIIIIIIITSTNDQDRCPQCGRVPPSKKGLPPEKISQAIIVCI